MLHRHDLQSGFQRPGQYPSILGLPAVGLSSTCFVRSKVKGSPGFRVEGVRTWKDGSQF